MNSLLKNARFCVLWLAPLAALFWAAGCGSVGSSGAGLDSENLTRVADAGGATDVHNEGGDVLRVGDPIAITFLGVSDPPPPFSERIKADGMIRLPLIKDPIQAEGKTRGELEEEIHRRYVPKIYRQLTVKVASEGRIVHVSGEVKAPSRIQYFGEMTALKAITAAGGFTDFANRKKVIVTRADGKKIFVNCVKALKDAQYDVPVYPDDQIEVRRRLF